MNTYNSLKSHTALAHCMMSRMDKQGPACIAVIGDHPDSSLVPHLVKKGCSTHTFCLEITPAELAKVRFDGFILTGSGSNEGNQQLRQRQSTLTPLLRYIKQMGMPVLGVGLGHQLLAVSEGLQFRNQQGSKKTTLPVKNRLTGKIEIKELNNGCFLGLRPGDMNRVEVTHISINDNHVEGVQYKRFPGFGVQFVPSPADYLLNHFIDLVKMRVFRKKDMGAPRRNPRHVG